MDNLPIPPEQNLEQPVISPSPKINPQYIIGGFFIMALILTGGIFIGKNMNSSQKTPDKEIIPTPSSYSSPTVTSIPDSTANWKTYKYSNFGYSFTLPKTYIVSENQLIPTSPLTIQSLSLNETNASQGPNDIGIFVVNSRLEDRLTEMKRDNFEKVNSVKIVKGTTWTIAYNNTFRETQYLNYHNGKTYILGGRNTGFLDQILSTFKFVGKDETANWETYNDPNGVYQIKFPNTWEIADTKLLDYYDYPTIFIRPKMPTMGGWRSGQKLEIVVGSFIWYSTSGSLCANETCEDLTPLFIQANNQSFKANLVKGSVTEKAGDPPIFDFFRFQFASSPSDHDKFPRITVTYFNEDQLSVIKSILSTFKFPN